MRAPVKLRPVKLWPFKLRPFKLRPFKLWPFKLWPYAALVVAGVTWGLGFPLAWPALKELSPPHLMLLRFLAASVVCAPLALRNATARKAFRDPVVWIAGAIYGPAFVVQFEGLAHTSVTLSALMVGTLPAMIALIAPLIGERVTRMGWAGVAAATLGAVLIAARPGAAGTPLGIALLMVAMVAYVVWLIVLRKMRPNPDLLAAPCAMVVTSTAAIALVVLPLHGWPPTHLSWGVWGSVIGLGVLCTALATTAWQLGAARTASTTAGVFVNLEPVVGAGLGVAVFGDKPTLSLAVGGVLIVAGSVLAVLGERRAEGRTVTAPREAV